MLSRAHRLRRSAEFSHVVRRGVRASSASLVVHQVVRDDGEPSRIGFVVNRAVGDAPRRNRVKRQLRHLMSAKLSTLPAHTSLVVRTNPAAREADATALATDLDRCLATLGRRRAGSRS